MEGREERKGYAFISLSLSYVKYRHTYGSSDLPFLSPFCSMIFHPSSPLQKASGKAGSDSSASSTGPTGQKYRKSQNSSSQNRPGISPRRHQMASRHGKDSSTRGSPSQVATKRAGKGIEIGSFREPQQTIDGASDAAAPCGSMEDDDRKPPAATLGTQRHDDGEKETEGWITI